MQHNTQRDSRSLPPLTEENEPIIAVVIAMLKSRAQSMHLDDTEARMYSNVMDDVAGEMEKRGGVVLDAPITTGVDREAPAAMDTKSQATGSGGNLRMGAKEFVHVFLVCLQQMEPAGLGIATTRMFHILDAVEDTLGFFGYEGDIRSTGRVTRVIDDIYGKYRNLAAQGDATEAALTSGLRRELASALTARGPYPGIGGSGISLTS